MERTYSVHETAHILGFCLDSVRRHLRSGKLSGVRVGRKWRVSETNLAAYLGMESQTEDTLPPAISAPAAESQSPSQPKEAEDEVVAPLLRTAPVRTQILDIVEQAAINTNLRPKKAQYLLEDLDILLRQQ